MKSKIVVVLIFPLVLLVVFYCNSIEPPTPPPPPPEPNDSVRNSIVLTTEWVDLKEIGLHWNKSQVDTLNSFNYELKRTNPEGTKKIFNFLMAGDDTTFIDNNDGLGLQSGAEYIYKVEAYAIDSLKDSSKTLTALTLDTASHNFNWIVDTIGVPGNILVDVWGYDENNVWAIGAVDLPEGRSGVIKWNGSKWEVHPGFGAEKKGIYGLDPDNIFVVGSTGAFGAAGIWDGFSWVVTDFLFHYPQGDTIWGLRAVWGTSRDNIWAVGHQGTIVHWNGEEWHKVQGINNQLSFWDIYGFDDENIYAVGNTPSTLFIYKYNGIEWLKFYEDSRVGSRTSSIWGPHKNLIYVTDTKEYRIRYGNVFEFFIRGQESVIYKIRGSSANNIFTCGAFGEVFHYNGTDWQKQTELYAHPYSRLLSGIWANDEVVFIVGLTGDFGAITIRGEKLK